MLYRFLVVDDEYYVRQRVKLCIPWEKYGFTCAGEAEDVEQALSFLQHERVDLIILDISMPGRNGLELVRILRRQELHAHFIILSGFASFEYARQAMAFGVTHYLLKPVDVAELRRTVDSIREALDNRRRTAATEQTLLRARTAADRSMREKFLQSVLSGHTAGVDEERLRGYGICPEGIYHLLVLAVRPSALSGFDFEQRSSLRLAAHNIASETAAGLGCVCACTDEQGRSVLILPCSGESPQELIGRISGALEASAGPPCIAAYSKPFGGTPDRLAAAYGGAMRFFTFRVIYGEKADMTRAGHLTKHTQDILQKKQSALNLALLQGESMRFAPLLFDWFDVVRREQLALSALEIQLSALLSVAMTYSAECSGGAPGEDAVYSASGLLNTGEDLAQIEEHLLQLFLSLADESKNENSPLIEKAVAQAIDLMRSEYACPDMGLRYLAARLVISPAYLSRNFTRICGMTLMQYLTGIRMERAKELLASPEMTVTQAAELVGYQDAFYFSKRFKSYFGISPSRMQEM